MEFEEWHNILCIGEWEIINVEEEKNEDGNEDDRFTNTSFFI